MKNKQHGRATWSALALAYELGILIAVPLVLFALGGRLVDRHFGTSPWFLLVGILLSILASSIAVARKATKIMQEASGEACETESEQGQKREQ